MVSPYTFESMTDDTGWAGYIDTPSSDVSVEGGINDFGLIVTADLERAHIKGTRCGLIVRAPATLTDITISDFFGDAIIITSSNVTLKRVEIRTKRVGIPYRFLHPDGIQLIAVDKQNRPTNGVLENIVIEDLTIYCPYVDGVSEGIQGVFAGDCTVKGLVVNRFSILTDIDEHGITVNTGFGCVIDNGECSSINTNKKVGVILSDRKGIGAGSDNAVSNVGADFFELDGDWLMDNKIKLTSLPPDNDSTELLAVWAAGETGTSFQHMMALIEQETQDGYGMLKDGRKKILFECHVYTRLLVEKGIDIYAIPDSYSDIVRLKPYSAKAANKSDRYGSLENQWVRFHKAETIDEECAKMACSVGLGQTMVFNYAKLGYESPDDMWNALDNPRGQVEAMVRFIKANNIAHLLRDNRFSEFKKVYNGSGKSNWATEYTKRYSRLVMRSTQEKTPQKSRTITSSATGLAATAAATGTAVYTQAEEKTSIATEIQKGVDSISTLTGIPKDELASRATNIAINAVDQFSKSDSFVLGALGIVTIAFLVVLYAYLDDNGYFGRFK